MRAASRRGDDPTARRDVSHARHRRPLRATSFLIADGVLPSNEGRGYVLRRIMRRAMRHAHRLGCDEPLMYRLVPALVREMGDAYPELVRAPRPSSPRRSSSRRRASGTRSSNGLEAARRSLRARSARAPTFPGDVAFKLYDTFGFPLDLTEDALRAARHRRRHQGLRRAP